MTHFERLISEKGKTGHGAGPKMAALWPIQIVRRSIANKLFALIAATILLPLIIFYLIFGHSYTNLLKRDTIKKVSSELEIKAAELGVYYSQIAGDAVILKEVFAMKELIKAIDEGDSDKIAFWRQGLAEVFLAFAKSSPKYYQIRYIDEKGREVVRINSNRLIQWVVPQHELQDKSDRDYFKGSIELKKGQIYVSAVELNREYDKIEEPHRPVLRIAAPLLNFREEKRGIIIINYFVDYLIKEEELLIRSLPGENDFLMVDNQGYYIFHPVASKRFGGPADLNTGQNLSRDYPGIDTKTMLKSKGALDLGEKILLNEPIQFGPEARHRALLINSVLKSALFSHYHRFRTIFVVGFLIVAAGSFASAIMIAGWLKKLIALFLAATNEATRGNFDVRLQVKSQDEFLTLGQNFNIMMEKLNEYHGELQGKIEELETTLDKVRTSEDIINSVNDGVLFTGTELRIMNCNRAFEAMSGYNLEEIKGQKPSIFSSGRESYKHNEISEKIAQHGFWRGELFNERKNGEPWETLVHINKVIGHDGSHIGYVGVYHDITQMLRIQREFARLDKISTIAKLSAMAVHETKNKLSIIGMNAQLMRYEEMDPQERGRTLETIINQVSSASSMLDKMRRFSRIDVGEPLPLALNGLVKETLSLFERELKYRGIDTDLRLSPEDAVVLADKDELMQVFYNIIINAYDAMPEGGHLDIEVRSEDHYASVVFKDTGIGIPEENLGKIFEPFFTTRPPEQGTGLGLAVCKDIVTKYKGEIKAKSSPGKGTSFMVCLPQLKEKRGIDLNGRNR